MSLNDEQLTFFRNQGYLVATDVVPPAVIDDIRAEIDAVIDAKARQLLAADKITELHEGLGFLYRATAIAAECAEITHPVHSGTHAGPAMFRLLACPQILDVMEQLLGPEVIASSVYRLRPKLPDRPEGNVPWHQDSGYFGACGDDHLIVTCWVPLMNATVEAGCMEVVPQSHRHGIVRHYRADVAAPPLAVHPDHLPAGEPVPVPADIGDIVLLTNLTCHRSTPNTSGQIRWAADLRYNAPAAGNYYPSEAEFLARSAASPDAVLADAEAFFTLRREHTPDPAAAIEPRGWLPQADETFIKPPWQDDQAHRPTD
jgi:ectoine hydroxylase-related dioxygenase (phytanoyl-CoA dioxygenase family)